MKRALLSWALLAVSGMAASAAKDSCVECHSVLEDALKAPAAAFPNDVHGRFGFSCADCHGGDRNADDPSAAMSRARGFIGKPARLAVPKLCARCHSDAGAHAQVQTAGARGPVCAILDQHPREAHRGGRRSGGDLHRLSRRARYQGGQRRAFARSSAAPARNLRALPCRSAAHGEVQDSDRPVRGVPEERALGGAREARGPLGAELRFLPWQPRRHTAGRG